MDEDIITLAPDVVYTKFIRSTRYLHPDAFCVVEGPERQIEVVCSRSGAWETLRNEVVKKTPWCNICGKNKLLQVHHVHPFHLYPEFELTPENLRVLCQACHLSWGHLGDWKSFNLDIDKDIERIIKRPYSRI